MSLPMNESAQQKRAYLRSDSVKHGRSGGLRDPVVCGGMPEDDWLTCKRLRTQMTQRCDGSHGWHYIRLYV